MDPIRAGGDNPAFDDLRPKSEPFDTRALLDNGLLWAINRYVFHPRGYALSWLEETDTWELWGDGSEPWQFQQGLDDEKFAAFNAVLAGLTYDEEG